MSSLLIIVTFSAFSTDCSYLPTLSSREVYFPVFFQARIERKLPLSLLGDLPLRRQLWSFRRMGAAIPADNLCFFVIFAFLSQLSLQSSLVSTFVHTSVALHCHSSMDGREILSTFLRDSLAVCVQSFARSFCLIRSQNSSILNSSLCFLD